MIDSKLLEILACPECREDVEYDAKNEKLICTGCGLKYPVKNGIPVMIVEEAEKSDLNIK
ncbi:MAG: Trm112 family protein [Spirochaetes bacterium]|nr:Trm112 family protein [Spirochaetota bacterium]